jgi:hypothetical protein
MDFSEIGVALSSFLDLEEVCPRSFYHLTELLLKLGLAETVCIFGRIFWIKGLCLFLKVLHYSHQRLNGLVLEEQAVPPLADVFTGRSASVCNDRTYDRLSLGHHQSKIFLRGVHEHLCSPCRRCLMSFIASSG